MKVRASLHRLVRSQDPRLTQRLLLAATLAALVRQRRRGLVLAAPLLARLPATGRAKLDLWRAVARALAGGPPSPLPSQALQATQAYREARERLDQALWSPYGRGRNYEQLLARLRQRSPDRVLLFHHHDSRGLLPRSWIQVLLACQRAGWQVVCSSSRLQAERAAELEGQGVWLAERTNLGLCLGAYKDLSLLLLQDPSVVAGLRSLVLCNDSTLPLAADQALSSQLAAWDQAGQASEAPLLASLTDSAERGSYHLQSYLLHANAALLQHPAWLRFWLGFSPFGSKDELIDTGEIGLSQALLAADVALRPAYPLVAGLLDDPAMGEELQRYGIGCPHEANPSLFAWQSLLARGFPLVKKHVLFNPRDNQPQPLELAALSRWISPERRALLVADLQELFVSRYAP